MNEEFVQKFPEVLRPYAEKYASQLINLGSQEICDWIDLVLCGKSHEARLAVLQRLNAEDLLAEGDVILDDWKAVNIDNAYRVKEGREAACNILRTCWFMVLNRVGIA